MNDDGDLQAEDSALRAITQVMRIAVDANAARDAALAREREAAEALEDIARTVETFLIALDKGALNKGDDWLRSDYEYLRSRARAALSAVGAD